MFECNIDAKGKAARFLGGAAAILGSLILLRCSPPTRSRLVWGGTLSPGASSAVRSPSLRLEPVGASYEPLASKPLVKLVPRLGTLGEPVRWTVRASATIGRQGAAEVETELLSRIDDLKGHGVEPHLAVIIVGDETLRRTCT